jgi:hypothetical protein
VQPLPLAAPIVDEPGAPGGAVDPSTTGPQTPDSGPTPQVVANAGGDLTVTEGEEAVLDGSQSSGPAGTPLSFQWQQVDGPPVELIDATSSQARFTAPDVEADTTLTFSLNVSAGGASATAACRVTVVNQLDPASTEPQVQPELAITASPSPAEGPAPLQVAFTAGTLNGQPLSDGTYTWDFGDNTVSQGRNVSHVFANAGTYVVTLCLAVGTGASGPMSCTEVTVKVNDAQRPTGGGGAPPAPISSPVVSDQEVDAEEDAAATLTLQGSDPANGDLTFVVVSAPAHGTLGAIDNTAQASGSVAYTPEAGFSGTDTFTFKAHNGTNESNVATFTVKVKPKAGALAVSPAGALVSTGTLGGPFAPASITYTLSNTGRSAIDWTAGKTKTWVTLSKAGGNLAAGATDTVVVSINSGATSLAADSYTDTVTFANTTNGSGNTTRQVSLAVGTPPPGVLSVSPAGGWSSSGSQGGPFNPASITYTLSNTGGSSANWTAAKTQTWVSLSKAGGTLAAGATDTVVVSLNAGANGLANGLYNDTVTFTNTTNANGNTTRSVSLTIGGFPISGTVTRIIAGGGTAPVAGLGLTFTGSGASAGQNFTATTAADGTYTALAPVGWTGSSAAADPDNWRLTPTNRSYTNVQAGQPGQDLTAARNYYVATTGSDTTAGTLEAPFRNPQKAANVVQPGDTVRIRTGTYDASLLSGGGAEGTPVLSITRDATIDAPITFQPYGDGSVTFDARGINNNPILIQGDYNVVERFYAINGKREGIYIFATWRTTGAPQPVSGPPVFTGTPTGRQVRGCTVRECVVMNNSAIPSTYSPGIRIYGQVSDCLVDSCLSKSNGMGINMATRDAINTFRTYSNMAYRDPWPDAPRNCIIRNCIACYNQTYPENSDGISASYATNCSFINNISFANDDDGIDVLAGVGCTIQGNVVFGSNPNGTLEGDGNGLKVGTRGGGGNLVARNIAFLNPAHGFDNDDGSYDQYVNNTAYKNYYGFWVESDKGPNSFINNISYLNSNGDVWPHLPFSPVSSDYNYWGDGLPPYDQGTGVAYGDAHSQSASDTTKGLTPAGPAGFAAPIDDLHQLNVMVVDNVAPGGVATAYAYILSQIQTAFGLQPTSPCVDTATTFTGVTDAYRGTAPDKGAIETGG